MAGPKAEKRSEGAILQQFPAEEYEGQTVRLRAWVKLEGGEKGERIKVAFMADGDSRHRYTQKGRGWRLPSGRSPKLRERSPGTRRRSTS